MNLEQTLELVVGILNERGLSYALAGGLAASLYRDELRVTQDIDIVLISDGNTLELAESLLKELKLKPRLARKADLEGGPLFAIKRNNTPPLIVAGRDPQKKEIIGVDFILPAMPWANAAVERAKSNQIDFGFGKVPTISVEDLIVAKLWAICGSKKREKDVDDLRSIFSVGHELDCSYIVGHMQEHLLRIPESLEGDVPEVLVNAAKRIKRATRPKVR